MKTLEWINKDWIIINDSMVLNVSNIDMFQIKTKTQFEYDGNIKTKEYLCYIISVNGYQISHLFDDNESAKQVLVTFLNQRPTDNVKQQLND